MAHFHAIAAAEAAFDARPGDNYRLTRAGESGAVFLKARPPLATGSVSVESSQPGNQKDPQPEPTLRRLERARSNASEPAHRLSLSNEMVGRSLPIGDEQILDEHKFITAASSYRRIGKVSPKYALTKSRSMMTLRKDTQPGRHLRRQSMRSSDSSGGSLCRPTPRLYRSTSFLQGMIRRRSGPQADITANPEAMKMAQKHHLSQIPYSRPETMLTAPSHRSSRDMDRSYMTVCGSDQQIPIQPSQIISQKPKSFSEKLRHVFQRLLHRTPNKQRELPSQQLNSCRKHYRANDLSDMLSAHTVTYTEEGGQEVPGIRIDHWNSEDMAITHATDCIDNQADSDDPRIEKSRVTSWADSTNATNLSMADFGNYTRLSLIEEDHHVKDSVGRSQSDYGQKSDLAAFSSPVKFERTALRPESTRIYSALQRELQKTGSLDRSRLTSFAEEPRGSRSPTLHRSPSFNRKSSLRTQSILRPDEYDLPLDVLDLRYTTQLKSQDYLGDNLGHNAHPTHSTDRIDAAYRLEAGTNIRQTYSASITSQDGSISVYSDRTEDHLPDSSENAATEHRETQFSGEHQVFPEPVSTLLLRAQDQLSCQGSLQKEPMQNLMSAMTFDDDHGVDQDGGSHSHTSSRPQGLDDWDKSSHASDTGQTDLLIRHKQRMTHRWASLLSMSPSDQHCTDPKISNNHKGSTHDAEIRSMVQQRDCSVIRHPPSSRSSPERDQRLQRLLNRSPSKIPMTGQCIHESILAENLSKSGDTSNDLADLAEHSFQEGHTRNIAWHRRPTVDNIDHKSGARSLTGTGQENRSAFL